MKHTLITETTGTALVLIAVASSGLGIMGERLADGNVGCHHLE